MSKFRNINGRHAGLFALGVLFGTAGIKVLSSRDAKKVYTHCTAAVLRARECVLDTAAVVQENAEDILEDAKAINEEYAAADLVYEDEKAAKRAAREASAKAEG